MGEGPQAPRRIRFSAQPDSVALPICCSNVLRSQDMPDDIVPRGSTKGLVAREMGMYRGEGKVECEVGVGRDNSDGVALQP